MNTKHTPGPWFAVDYAGKFDIQNGPMYEDKDLLCYDTIWSEEDVVDKEEAEANAALMASAPELFEGCQAAIAIFRSKGIDESHSIVGEVFAKITSAIKKATEPLS